MDTTAPPRKPITLHRLRQMHTQGEPIAMATCYDATFARALDAAGIDCMLVGDSLGMVLQGNDSTLPVTLDEMAYHTRCAARGNRSAWLIGDLPFGSYQQGPAQAMQSSMALMQAGAQMVKLEGGGWTTDIVGFLTERGVPVCAHLGLTPQSVHALGGWRVQGRGDEAAAALLRDAVALAEAGAAMLVLELVPATLAREVTRKLRIPTIGIGAGVGCSGQVLVLHDLLGVTPTPRPRFVRDFSAEGGGVHEAMRRYVAAVKNRSYPDDALHAAQ